MSDAVNIGATPRPRASLIERASEAYDFGALLRAEVLEAPIDNVRIDPTATIEPRSTPVPVIVVPEARADVARSVVDVPDLGTPPDLGEFATAPLDRAAGAIDRIRLAEEGFIVPDAPPSMLIEEFRLVKRQLLRSATGADPRPKDRMIMICSAQPDEGKTFCSVNLALSLASERDIEVLLVDADVAKPEVLSTLGIAGSLGLMDAISDPSIDVETLIVHTDVPKLSVLPVGRATNDDTELLSSVRASTVLQSLVTSNPARIVVIDTAPALAASPASAIAHQVGRVVMVVRADKTTESELRDAVALLDGCPDIALLLNRSSYFGSNRTFGSYYGQEQ